MSEIAHKRILFCVGCNDYLDTAAFDTLGSAEKDATSIYEALSDGRPADYDADGSRLFLSPELDEIRSELKSLILQSGPIDTLTFFFAGHGTVNKGSLYLCVKDTYSNALSVSAFSVSDLLRMVADQQIKHTNIIIDACQSAALLADLNVILKHDAIGARDTPGLTLLAMAASDEYASETNDGGIGTQSLLECINGSRTVNTERGFLGLMEIGRAVSDAFSQDPDQQPVCWGLNLTGASLFCRNPNYNFEPVAEMAEPDPAFPGHEFAISEADKNWLWKAYLGILDDWEARAFYERLSNILEGGDASAADKIAFVRQTASTFAEQARENRDQIVAAEVYAVSGLALLRFSELSNSFDSESQDLFEQSIHLAQSALVRLNQAFATDNYALLSEAGGAFDLYYLPIRMMKILGWSALGVLSLREGSDATIAEETFRQITAHTLSEYPHGFCAMNDVQAGPLALFGAALKRLDQREALSRVLEFYMHSLATEKGLIADSNIPETKIFDFLEHRRLKNLNPAMEIIAKPSELAAVCLRLASYCGMQEEVDDCLIDLDHLAINAYLPVDYVRIGDEVLEGGINVTMRIGHDIFTVEEFEQLWPTSALTEPVTRAQHLGNLISGLVFRDRTAWSELRVDAESSHTL